MKLEEQLRQRSGNVCELSGASDNLTIYQVPFAKGSEVESSILISEKCLAQIEKREELNSSFWEVVIKSKM